MRRIVRSATITSIVAYGPMLLLHGWCISGLGAWAIPGSELFVLVPLAAAAVAVLTLPFFISRRMRRGALQVFAVAATLLVLFIPALGASSRLRTLGFYLAAQRAEPLISGIERYVRENGAPPDQLRQLVPQYLPALPSRTPQFEIVVGETAREHYGGNDWALFALVSTGIINWDQFIYYPNQDYPRAGHGGGIQRIGRWAYVHE